MRESEIKFATKGVGFESNIGTIKATIEFLKKFKKQSELVENANAADAFNYIYVMTAHYISGSTDLLNIYNEKNLLQVLYNVIEYFSSICNTLKVPGIDGYSKHDARKNDIMRISLQILNFLLLNSIKLRSKYFQMCGARGLLKFLNTEKFCNNFQNEEIFSKIVTNINLLSKNADLYKYEWNELNAVETILKVSKIYSPFKLIAYLTFINIANDKQINKLPELNDVIEETTRIIIKAAKSMATGNLIRERHPFIEDDETTSYYDVYVVPIDDNKLRFSLTGILLNLNKLSVNNKIKYTIYTKANFKESLREIILNGSIIEKRYSLHLLAQLCFDDQVLGEVDKDTELIKYIESMTKPENCSMKAMRKLCEQIKWRLTMENTESDLIKNEDKAKTVFISYYSNTKELCFAIRSFLEKHGFKVLIDVNEGSRINPIIKAVESCDYFLMCLTEKYRQSVSCQLEAQYAYKLKKTIIPVIMQKGYEDVGGWLGKIIENRINVNLMNNSYSKTMT